jgi:hypothetical protein
MFNSKGDYIVVVRACMQSGVTIEDEAYICVAMIQRVDEIGYVIVILRTKGWKTTRTVPSNKRKRVTTLHK